MTRSSALLYTEPHTRSLPSFALVVFVSLLLFSALQLRAQTGDEEIIEVRTDLVTVPVIITDRRNRPATSLTAADFKLYDDNYPVQTALFTAGVERLALAFVFDASGSVREHIARQEQASRALLNRFTAPRVAVFHFTAQTQLVLPFTDDKNAAQRAFTISAQPDHRTAIFDAALAAVRSFDRLAARELERRIIILVSDGLDTASTVAPAAVINEANRRGIAIYVLHLPLYTPRDGRLAPRTPAKGFRDLARRTGGNYYLIGDTEAALNPRIGYDFTQTFNDIAADLRSQYILGFYPLAREASSTVAHLITVKLTAAHKRELRLRQLRESYTLRLPTSSSKQIDK